VTVNLKKAGWTGRTVATALALGTAAVLGWTACSLDFVAAKPASKSAGDNKMAPDFALKDVDGRTVRLSDYKGKVVVRDFWATWCGPCKVEVPWFSEFETKNKDRGFAVLGVDMDDEGWAAVKPFLKELNVTYRVVMGDDKTAEQYGGIEALPTTYLIDREGRIVSEHVGLTSKKEFENGIEQLLQNNQKTARKSAPALTAFLAGPARAGSEDHDSRAEADHR
jgi:peroxiredoxin